VAREQPPEPAQPGHGRDAPPQLVLRAPAEREAQILLHGLFDEKRLRVLRQQPQPAARLFRGPAQHRDGAAVRPAQPGQQPQRCGLARAVAAQNREQLAPADDEREPLHHIRGIFFIFEPRVLHFERDFRVWIGFLLHRRDFSERVPLGVAPEPRAALPHGDGAGQLVRNGGIDPHRRGHCGEHRAAAGAERLADAGGRPLAHDPAPAEHDDVGRKREDLLEPVLRQQDRGAELAVDPAQRREKIGRGDRVELRGGLVEQQAARLHRHDRGEIEQLLLSAGQLADGLVEPALDAEEGGHLGDAPADGGRVGAEALEPERELVPDLVGHKLVVGALQHEADAAALPALAERVERKTLEQDLARALAVRGERGLELAQERRFSAAGGPADHGERARGDAKAHAVERLRLSERIGEAQIADCIRFHWRSSFRSSRIGVRQRAR